MHNDCGAHVGVYIRAWVCSFSVVLEIIWFKGSARWLALRVLLLMMFSHTRRYQGHHMKESASVPTDAWLERKMRKADIVTGEVKMCQIRYRQEGYCTNWSKWTGIVSKGSGSWAWMHKRRNRGRLYGNNKEVGWWELMLSYSAFCAQTIAEPL